MTRIIFLYYHTATDSFSLLITPWFSTNGVGSLAGSVSQEGTECMVGLTQYSVEIENMCISAPYLAILIGDGLVKHNIHKHTRINNKIHLFIFVLPMVTWMALFVFNPPVLIAIFNNCQYIIHGYPCRTISKYYIDLVFWSSFSLFLSYYFPFACMPHIILLR